jgi:hypothetical protein
VIAVPGDTVHIGSFTVQVAEMYLRVGSIAEVVTTDGRTFTTPVDAIRRHDAGEEAGSGLRRSA